MTYIKTFDDANPGYTGGSFAYLRLNHDEMITPGSIERYGVISNADDSPFLTLTTTDAVPEPLTILGTVAALGMGAAMKRKLSA